MVDYGNRATVLVGGKEYEIEASNGACLLYANEFRGKVDAPYAGSLASDIVIENTDCASKGIAVPTWIDYQMLLRAIWAMARAARSYKGKWADFEKRVMSAPASMYEPLMAAREMFEAGGLGSMTFFRVPDGPNNASEPNDNE